MTACNIAPGGTVAEPALIEEVEVGADVEPQRLREFVSACGVTRAEAERIVSRCAHMATGASRSMILRVERHGDEVEWRVRTELEHGRAARGRPRRTLGEVVRI
jgi:hypothetical protein